MRRGVEAAVWTAGWHGQRCEIPPRYRPVCVDSGCTQLGPLGRGDCPAPRSAFNLGLRVTLRCPPASRLADGRGDLFVDGAGEHHLGNLHTETKEPRRVVHTPLSYHILSPGGIFPPFCMAAPRGCSCGGCGMSSAPAERSGVSAPPPPAWPFRVPLAGSDDPLRGKATP